MKKLSLAQRATVGAALFLAVMAAGSIFAPAMFSFGAIAAPITLLFFVPYLHATKSPSRAIQFGMIILTAAFLALVSVSLVSISLPLWWAFNQVVSILAIAVMWINAP